MRFTDHFTSQFKAPIGWCLAVAVLGCHGRSPTAPSASAPTAPSASASSPVSPGPAVTGMSVTVGSTSGGTRIILTGSDLDRGATTVSFDSVAVSPTGYDPRFPSGTSLLITTPAHAAGVVDVVITNPNGQRLRIDKAYEFVDPASFDFNGRWSGVSIDGQDVAVEFVVAKNELVSAACEYSGKITAALSAPVTNGSFSAEGVDRFRLSGRIVSAGQATGRLSAPGCVAFSGDTVWQAYKVN